METKDKIDETSVRLRKRERRLEIREEKRGLNTHSTEV
jgi:hypothetical protein